MPVAAVGPYLSLAYFESTTKASHQPVSAPILPSYLLEASRRCPLLARRPSFPPQPLLALARTQAQRPNQIQGVQSSPRETLTEAAASSEETAVGFRARDEQLLLM